MPKNLKRITGRGHLHFITFSCYQRRPLLASVSAPNITAQFLKEIRDRYHFALLAYDRQSSKHLSPQAPIRANAFTTVRTVPVK